MYQLQARQVLKWRREKPNQAEKIWDALSATNTDIFDTLETLNAQYRVSIWHTFGGDLVMNRKPWTVKHCLLFCTESPLFLMLFFGFLPCFFILYSATPWCSMRM